LLKCALVIDQQFRITNNVDEQDVTYLELNFRFGLLRRHFRTLCAKSYL
jgi:hypothetical protein